VKRSWLIFLGGLAVAALGYSGLYHLGTARHRGLEHSSRPELAWLKAEFRLGDAEFDRICKLHDEYLPDCREMCRRIDQKNEELGSLLAAGSGVTPALEQALTEVAQLRVECQKRMLRHFHAVSQTMPAEQGRRYLAWMREKTLLPSFDMREQHGLDSHE
jgi:hypothetical protein